jgi:single-strand DNA-binding protein
MPALNRIQLIGNLGRDPETKYTPTGKKVTTFTLAVDRRWKSADGETKAVTDWFLLEAWGRQAEVIQQYLHKGSLVYIEGRVQTDRYEQGNEMHYITKVIVRQIQMLSRKPEEEEPTLPEAEEDATDL